MLNKFFLNWNKCNWSHLDQKPTLAGNLGDANLLRCEEQIVETVVVKTKRARAADEGERGRCRLNGVRAPERRSAGAGGQKSSFSVIFLWNPFEWTLSTLFLLQSSLKVLYVK